MNSFEKWILAKGGPGAVAKLLGVTAHTVRNWREGRSTPHRSTMQRIVYLAKGVVTYYDILALTLRNQNTRLQ